MDKQTDQRGFLAHGARTGARIAALDWSQHPLGPIPAWDPALRSSLATLLGSALPGFLLWGEDLTLFFNDAYEPLLGQKAHSLGSPFPAVWHEVWDSLAPYVRRVLAGESLSFEQYATTLMRNGAPQAAWFTFSYSPVRDEGGRVRGLACTCIDVSAQARAAAHHAQTAARLALVLDAAALGAWWLNLDQTGLDGDAAFASLFPDPDQVAAAPGLGALLHPDDQPRLAAALEQARLTGTGFALACRIAGSQAGSDARWVQLQGACRLDPGSGRQRFAGVARALSAPPAQAAPSEPALAGTAHFSGIAAVLPQMLWSSNVDGSNYQVNGRWHAFTGVDADALARHGWQAVLHPDDLEPLQAAWRQSCASAGLFEVAHRLRHRDGGYRWVLNRAMPALDEAGQVTHWIGTLLDIHDQKTDAEALRAGARRRDEFLAMLAHELRNPLAPISAAAQLLTMAHVGSERIRQSSEVIIRQVRHMTALVDALLDVSRVTRGKVVLARELVDLTSIVTGAIEQARPLIEARAHRLELELDAAGARILGDRTRLVQVLAILLNNAAKYTPQGGRIALAVSSQAGMVTISVRDNGVGISADMLGQVFELFSQAERTPDRSQGGLGLGLALARSLVELHGGRISAYSAGLGGGSTFTLAFAVAPASAGAGLALAAPVAGLAPPPLAAQGGGRRVLIVDDNVDAAQALADVLAALGHTVSATHSPGAALAIAAANWPDMFILDIGLPDIDGYELVRRLRALQAQRPTCYAALTGYGQEHDRELAHSAGFDHHFVKPVDLADLCAVLDRLAAEPGAAAVTAAGASPHQPAPVASSDPDQAQLAPPG